MIRFNYNNLNSSNFNYLNNIKDSLIDPLGRKVSEEIKWLNLGGKWGTSKFPVVISGEGDPVLFLHGFDSCFLEFRRIYPLLRKNFKLFIPDLLGFGFSPRDSSYEYTPDNIILNLIDLIKELNLKKDLKIVGASMGGSVALKLTNEINNYIEKIILLSPAGLFAQPKRIPRPFNQIGAAFLGSSAVRKNLCRQSFAFPNKRVGPAEEQIASIHLGCKGWRNSLASFAKSGGFGGTKKYIQNIPTKTLCGDKDRILGSNELDELKKIRQLNAFTLKNCGHLPHLDLPELTGKIILDFFNK